MHSDGASNAKPETFTIENQTGSIHYEINLTEKPSSNNQTHRILDQTVNRSYLDDHREYETTTNNTGREYRRLPVKTKMDDHVIGRISKLVP